MIANVSYKLAPGHEIENLTLQGSDKIYGVGNEIANTITGNAADNNLSGLAGSDTLIGGEGNDRLDGGSGGDTMIGGKGNDVYIVDNAADTVTEAAGEGVDTVMQRVADLTLTANVEAVFLETGAVNAIGSTADNFMSGNWRRQQAGRRTRQRPDDRRRWPGHPARWPWQRYARWRHR